MNDENIGAASTNQAIRNSPVKPAAAWAPDDDCVSVEALGGRLDLGHRIAGGCDELGLHARLGDEDGSLFQVGLLLCARLVGHGLEP